MKHLFYLPLLLCLLLSNCTWLCTNQHFYNHAREGECVLLPGGTKGKMPLYKADGKVYVQGIRTTYIEKRSDYLNDIISPGKNWQHIKPDAPRSTVYGEVELRNGDWGAVRWHRRDTPWLTALPAGAKPYHNTRRLPEDSYLYVLEGKTLHAAQVTRPMCATARAAYDYPLAALCLVAVDTPATIILNTGLFVGMVVSAPFMMF